MASSIHPLHTGPRASNHSEGCPPEYVALCGRSSPPLPVSQFLRGNWSMISLSLIQKHRRQTYASQRASEGGFGPRTPRPKRARSNTEPQLWLLSFVFLLLLLFLFSFPFSFPLAYCGPPPTFTRKWPEQLGGVGFNSTTFFLEHVPSVAFSRGGGLRRFAC